MQKRVVRWGCIVSVILILAAGWLVVAVIWRNGQTREGKVYNAVRTYFPAFCPVGMTVDSTYGIRCPPQRDWPVLRYDPQECEFQLTSLMYAPTEFFSLAGRPQNLPLTVVPCLFQ